MKVATVEKEIWSSKALLSLGAQRIVMHQRARFRVTVLPIHRIERKPTQLRLEPELSKHPNCVRALLDARTDPGKGARLLVDLNSHANPQERGRSSKSSNTSAHDGDFDFFFQQGGRSANVIENVHPEGSVSQDRSHCCKPGWEIYWDHHLSFSAFP